MPKKFIIQDPNDIYETHYVELTESQARLLKWLMDESFLIDEYCIVTEESEMKWEEI